MSGAVSAGRLSIDIIAEVARLQADMDKVRGLVRAASGDIAKSAGAANDNLARIGNAMGAAGGDAVRFSNDVARLKASLDPVYAATQRYKSEVALLQRALGEGAISHRTYVEQMRGSVTALQAARNGMAGVTAASGAQRAGMQNLGFQLQDMAVQVAGGTSAVRALGQQLPQAIGAIGMMAKEGSKLATFMGGPWGAALGVGAAVLLPLIGNLMQTGDAASEATDKVYGLKEALADLKTKPMEAFGNLQANVFAAQGKLNAALAMPRGPRGGSEQYRRGTYIEMQRTKAIAAAQEELDAANQAMRVAQLTSKAIDTLGIGAQRAAAAHNTHTGAVRRGVAAVSEYEQALRRVASAYDALDNATSYGSSNLAGRIDQMLGATDPSKIIGAPAQESATIWDQIKQATEATGKELEGLLTGTDDWNKSLDSAFHRLRGMTGALGGLGISGAAGSALSTLLSAPAGMMVGADGKEFAATLGDRIENVFKGKDSAFGKTMTDVLQGVGTGLAVGTLAFGSDNKGAQFGSSMGGAIAGAFSKDLAKSIGGALGNIAGAALPVIGGLLGGALGSLLTTKPRGSGTVTNSSVTSSANNDGIKAGLDSFGLGLQQSVSGIADKLGGKVGSYSVGIGRYKDYYQVSSIGNDPFLGQTSYNRKSANALYDGLDGSAAMRAAIGAAIAQGAIQGIRAATSTLLKAGTDIEAQLGKALKFEGVFSDLKQATDPTAYALDNLARKFDDLRTIFKEAGASAEEYGQLEQLLAIQRADALDQARSAIVNKVSDPLNLQIRLLELIGESEKSVAATRLLELAGLKSSLQPMQAMVYTLEDAKAVIEKFTPLRDDLIKFRTEVLSGTSSSSFGFLTSQFRSTALAAGNGDATAMSSLRSTAQDYLDAAKENASTLAEYNRVRGEVLAATNSAIFAANEQIDYQQAVIDAAKSTELMAETLANVQTLTTQLVLTNNEVLRLWKRIDGDGFANPIQVEVVT